MGQTAKEEIVNPNQEQSNLSPRDYVARIEEVLIVIVFVFLYLIMTE